MGGRVLAIGSCGTEGGRGSGLSSESSSEPLLKTVTSMFAWELARGGVAKPLRSMLGCIDPLVKAS